MSLELEAFQSLNCSVCESPYSKSLNGPKYPRQLRCGKAVCDECWKKEEPLKKERRRHQCDLECDCYSCFCVAHFLLDLLNDSSIIKSSNGYLLLKPITNPLKCSKCDVKFSMEDNENKPVVLFCGHPICTRCYLTHRTSDRMPGWYSINCSICDRKSDHLPFDSMEARYNWLREFLRELPGLTDQIPQLPQASTGKTATALSATIEIADRFDCTEWVREFPIENMFWCLDCSKKICASCVVRQHRVHELTNFFAEETRRISQEAKQVVSIQIDGYKKIFPELHQQLAQRISAFETVLGDKVEGIAKLGSLGKINDEFDKCKDYGERFEQISANYLPHLRSFDTNLQNLIDELKEAEISETETKTEKK